MIYFLLDQVKIEMLRNKLRHKRTRVREELRLQSVKDFSLQFQKMGRMKQGLIRVAV